MKNFLTVLTAVALFGLVACEGPAGPAGKDGTSAGFTFFEGYKADLKCATCHSADSDTSLRVAAMKLQYEFSLHGEGTEYSHTQNTCNGCHTNEGFNERYRKGFANETFSLTSASGPITSQPITDVTRPGCFTCHAPHARGNFSVRDSGAVNIFTVVAGKSLAVWNGTKESNLCVKCHQPRMTSTPFNNSVDSLRSWQPDPSKTALTDQAIIKTTSWNLHVSGQMTQTLLGTGGFEIPGSLPYSNSGHTTLINSKSLGCPDCHMATVTSGTRNGGHTFAVRYLASGSTSPSYNLTGCNVTGCHVGVTTTEAHWTKRATIIAKIAELGKLMTDTTITKKWSLPQAGKAVAWVKVTAGAAAVAGDSSWSGISASATAPLVIVPAIKAGALWNLIHVQNDKSHGMHNYQYSLALLQNSIDELKK